MVDGVKAASPASRARLTGIVYLLYFLTAISGEVFVGRSHLAAYDAVDLLAHGFYVALVLLFYYLFKPVNRSISLFAAFLGLAGCADDVVTLFDLIPYKILSLAFFGPYCILIGGLILRSTFLPRILGALMVLAGVGWLIFLTPFAPPLASYLKVIGFVAEMSLMLWLIVKGVDVRRWQEQAGTTGKKEYGASPDL